MQRRGGQQHQQQQQQPEPPFDDDVNIIDDPSFRLPTDPGTQDTLQTIELREQPRMEGPPVHSGPTVITAQPPRGGTPRRPIQISSMDWFSTPRAEFSAFSGSHFLANLEQVELQQIVDLSTLLGRSERGFQYRVKIPKAETIFLAVESRSESGRPSYLNCSRVYHPNISFTVLDQCGETAFVMKITAGWSLTLSRLHKITVESSTPFGSVEENFSVLGPSFTVYDEARRPLCNIYGPKICGCCMYKEAQFQVLSTDGSHQIASLMHQWENTVHDYTSLITFPLDTDIKLKSLLLGASFLVEYLYYFRLRRAGSI